MGRTLEYNQEYEGRMYKAFEIADTTEIVEHEFSGLLNRLNTLRLTADRLLELIGS